MSELDTWLAQMPPEERIDEHIAEMERKLELYRTIKRLRDFAGVADGNGSTPPASGSPQEATAPAVPEDVSEAPSNPIDPARLSPERRKIIRVMLDHDLDAPPVSDITAGLRRLGVQTEEHNVATNLQRMRSAGLLMRIRKGRYTVVPEAAQLARELDAREQQTRMAPMS